MNTARHKFLVKWQGFSHEENTWEEFTHMFDIALDLVRYYYRERPHMTPDKRLPRECTVRVGLHRSTRRQEDRIEYDGIEWDKAGREIDQEKDRVIES
jgi:hypothetical protein